MISLKGFTPHWLERNIADAATADILLILDLPGKNQCGAIAEMGAALACAPGVSEPNQAVVDYTEALRLNPKVDYALFRRGLVYAQ